MRMNSALPFSAKKDSCAPEQKDDEERGSKEKRNRKPMGKERESVR